MGFSVPQAKHILYVGFRAFDERDTTPFLFPAEQRCLFFIQRKWMVHDKDLLYMYYIIALSLCQKQLHMPEHVFRLHPHKENAHSAYADLLCRDATLTAIEGDWKGNGCSAILNASGNTKESALRKENAHVR